MGIDESKVSVFLIKEKSEGQHPDGFSQHCELRVLEYNVFIFKRNKLNHEVKGDFIFTFPCE